MLVYQNSSENFISDIRLNKIADIMSTNFQSQQGWRPSPNEVSSWNNSLSKVRDILEIAKVHDCYIALEYQIPYNQSRLDCMIFGKNSSDNSNVFLIELKQWTKAEALEDRGNFVETYIGKSERVVAHPSQQVKGYHNYLLGFIEEFEKSPQLTLSSCAYCHNYSKDDNDGLYDNVYEKLINEYPIYSKEDTVLLANRVKDLLSKGDGFEIFNRFMQSRIKPSKKLLQNVSDIVKNNIEFSLINEQLVAKNQIWAKVSKSIKIKEKSTILVHGGPGTGKSVIAVNVLAEAAQRGKKVFYGCKSKPFIEGLKKIVGGNGKMLFSNLYRFLPSKIGENELDLLLIDEAHRVEKKSNHRFTKREDKTDMPQIDQLIRCAKTSVFFIDDRQNVRSQEIGNSKLIRESANKLNCDLSEITLESQFRCMGSNDYLLWLESVLGYSKEKLILRKDDIFDFQIMDSPQSIYNIISEKEKEKNNSARIIAGFCWPWSSQLDITGQLVKDVIIGDFSMPWETHMKITRPPQGYVQWYEWAYQTEGVKQVGCIYTAQGFEFDYVGVIIGDDLIYDPESDSLQADIQATADPMLRRSSETFETHVKNIYRTLLSRGMSGCYVYFTNKETEQFFKSRME